MGGAVGAGDMVNKSSKKNPLQLGSVAQTAVRRCKIPVIVMRPHSEGFNLQEGVRMKRKAMTLVASVDGSAVSNKAYDMACAMAKEGDRLKVLHVVDGQKTHNKPEFKAKNIKAFYEQEVMKLESTKKIDAEVVLITKAAYKSITDVINEYVDSIEADLLCMGSMELSDFSKRVYLGSTTEMTINKCGSNICVIKHYP